MRIAHSSAAVALPWPLLAAPASCRPPCPWPLQPVVSPATSARLFDAGTATLPTTRRCSSRQPADEFGFEQARPRSLLDPRTGIERWPASDHPCPRRPRDGSWLCTRRPAAPSFGRQRRGEHVSLPLQHGGRVPSGERALEVRGHTGGTPNGVSLCTRTTTSAAFCGDARWCGAVFSAAGDFQQGDAHTLYARSTEQLLSLPGVLLLYPGHGLQKKPGGGPGRRHLGLREGLQRPPRWRGQTNRDSSFYMEGR